MAKSLISWAIAGLLTYVWWWCGYRWGFLTTEHGNWSEVWLLWTIVTIAVLKKTGSSSTSGGPLDGPLNRIKGIVPHILGILVAQLVGLTVFAAIYSGFDPQLYIQAVAVIVTVTLTTAGWMGAVEDATN